MTDTTLLLPAKYDPKTVTKIEALALFHNWLGTGEDVIKSRGWRRTAATCQERIDALSTVLDVAHLLAATASLPTPQHALVNAALRQGHLTDAMVATERALARKGHRP